MDAAVITVASPDGTPLATVTVRDGEPEVDPPQAAAHPLVAAVLGQVRASAARPRRRPSC